MNKNPLIKLVEKQKEGKAIGIYSACSANKYVIKAALLRGKQDDSCVLIEATANQCDQYGGYTGMTPLDFRNFVLSIAKEVGFNTSKLFLGGDHLGPLTFAHLDEEQAMNEAKTLVHEYVKAGFTKIHIDTSMKVASDPSDIRLSDAIIAKRGACLAKVAQEAYRQLLQEDSTAIMPVYMVGSEVPIPGGSTSAVDEGVQVTKVEDMKATVAAFKSAFEEAKITEAWSQVIAVVVQPGVEEKDAGCTEYNRSKAVDLMAAIKTFDDIIYEGHSTDYQTKIKLKELVEDGVGILKVGPGLTFAMREALFALAYIEKEYLHDNKQQQSMFIEVLEAKMLEEPKYWQKHYHGNASELYIKRKYSFSDRSRYYMPMDVVNEAIEKMIFNLKDGIPLNLLSQFMPIQYTKVREGVIENKPECLIIDRIINTIDEYLYATNQKDLF